MNKINATGKLLGFDVSGEYFKIREFMAARSKRQYSKTPPTIYADYECIVADMVSFKVPSVNGAMYAHNFKDKKTKHCWTFPVKDASAETFIEVLLLVF